jgi:hypothetical protein
MAKQFTEVFEEIKANLSTSASGKPVKSFSRSDFDKLAKAFLNTPGYKAESVSFRGGELVKKELEPVKELRKMIQKILLDFGVDKQEAAGILEETYEIRSVEGIYELCSELIYQYANAGKKFDFITKEDFSGSILLKDVEAGVSTHKDIRTGEEFKVEKKAHKVLDKKSKVPKWLKNRI